DVDRALLCARAQVFVGDVAVVLAGPDHARRQVVGAQEVQEVVVVKAAVLVEQTLRQRDAVALRQARHQLGGRGALEVDVELDLGQGIDAHRSTSITIGSWLSGLSPRVTAPRRRPAACSALASSRAYTSANGRSP